MDAKLNSTDMNEKSHDSLDVPDSSITGQTGSLAQVTSFSEQASTEDTELSSADLSVNTHPNKTGRVTGAASVCGPCSVEEEQPKPLCALLPSSMKASTVHEVSQSFTSISKSQESLKTTVIHTEPGSDDLCAAILLACLFCHPLDCLLATIRGCNQCVWSLCSSLCSSLCGCEPTTLHLTHHCDVCGCMSTTCSLCDCPVCDICLQATECLDLAMEISQMLYH